MNNNRAGFPAFFGERNMKKVLKFVFAAIAIAGWAEEFVDESSFVQIECLVRPIDRSRIHRGQKSGAAGATVRATSTNWSGYIAAPSLSTSKTGSVTYAAGSWVVPSLLPTPDSTDCAIWVGIDGALSATVEQIGTSHNWFQGAQENFAWFEMYPNGSYELVGFPLDIGDQISARVSYKGNNVFKLVLFNHTKGISSEVPASQTTMAGTQRSCAEWVVEAPYSSGVLPLSDFRLVTFNYCSAVINGLSGTINDSRWVSEPVTMQGSSGVKALPSSLLKNGTCFTVFWEHE